MIKEIICDSCKEMTYLKGYVETHCLYCGEKIYTPFLPVREVCCACAEKKGICQACQCDIHSKKE